MGTPELFSLEDVPIEVLASTMNTAYNTSTGIDASDMTTSEEIALSIQDATLESYLASSSKALVGICDGTFLRSDIVQVTISEIETVIANETISSEIYNLGQTMINTYGRASNKPFFVDDKYLFNLRIRPGDFIVVNDAPPNIADGITFFNTQLDGINTSISPGETLDVSEWLFTTDSEVGPYLSGNDVSGFFVNMAFKMTPDDIHDYSFNVQWVKQPSSINTQYFENSPSVVVDQNKNTYVSLHARTSGSSTPTNIIVAKFDSSGTIQWNSKDISDFDTYVNATDRNERTNLVLDEDSNQLFISFITNGTLAGETSHGGFDAKIVSVDMDTGNFIWRYRGSEINTSNNEDIPNMSVGIFNNALYITNTVRGNTSESDGAYQGTPTSGDDIIFSKFDLSGNHMWTTHDPSMNTTGTEKNSSITSDSNDNLYIAYMSDSNVNSFVNKGGSDIYLAKADSSGTLIDIYDISSVNSSATDAAPILKYSPYDDTLYLCHYRQGPFEVVITKLNLDGTVIWTNTADVNTAKTYNEFSSMNVDPTNGMCVFIYSSGNTRFSDYDINIGAIDPSETVRYLESPSSLQTGVAEYVPSIDVTSSGDLRVVFMTEGNVVSGQHQGSRDLVVASLTKSWTQNG